MKTHTRPQGAAGDLVRAHGRCKILGILDKLDRFCPDSAVEGGQAAIAKLRFRLDIDVDRRDIEPVSIKQCSGCCGIADFIRIDDFHASVALNLAQQSEFFFQFDGLIIFVEAVLCPRQKTGDDT
jgi:hypothetical protein